MVEQKVRWNSQSVISFAAELADKEGLASLTLTGLAEKMGIRPPSLFNHIQNLGGLVRGIALLSSRELADALEAAAELGQTPPDSFQNVMLAYRDYVLAHPGHYEATLQVSRENAHADVDLSAAETRILEVCKKIAASFGLAGDKAIHAIRTWRALAHGFSDLERRGGFGIDLKVEESFRIALALLAEKYLR